jgi:hypothetical protein
MYIGTVHRIGHTSKYPATQWQLSLHRWEPEAVNMEPETVNRKGFQVTKSLEASPEVGGLKRNALAGSFATG